MALPSNPEAALNALVASRSKPEPVPADASLTWGVQAQVDAVMAATAGAEKFETVGGHGYRFDGKAVSRRAAA